MELTKILDLLDIVIRGLFIPLIWVFIFSSVPGIKEDIIKWTRLFVNNKHSLNKKRKTIQVYSDQKNIYSNSFSYSKFSYSKNI